MSNHRQLHPAVISRKLFYILQNVKRLLSDVNLFLFFLKKICHFLLLAAFCQMLMVPKLGGNLSLIQNSPGSFALGGTLPGAYGSKMR